MWNLYSPVIFWHNYDAILTIELTFLEKLLKSLEMFGHSSKKHVYEVK